jgi:uncharacterized repeat protein (TIGR04076 family)
MAEPAEQSTKSTFTLHDLRVTVAAIEGRSVCGLRVGDYFELTESSQIRIPDGNISACTRWRRSCRSCPRNNARSTAQTGWHKIIWWPVPTPKSA